MTENANKVPRRKRRRRSRFTSLEDESGANGGPAVNVEVDSKTFIPKDQSAAPINPAVKALRAQVASSLQQKKASIVENGKPVDEHGSARTVSMNSVRSGKRQRRSRFSGPDPSFASKPELTSTAFTQSLPLFAPFAPSDREKLPPRDIDPLSIPIRPVSTAEINRNEHKRRKLNAVLKISKNDLLDKDPARNPFYDPMIKQTISRSRPPREIKFVPQGEIAAQAERKREAVRVQARREEYRKRLAEGEGELPVLPPLSKDLRVKDATVPEWEWWDLPFVSKQDGNPGTNMDGGVKMAEDFTLREDRITHYIHHPPLIEPSVPKKPLPVLPLMLTKKESKKLRRQRRQEAQKEKQEMIALGLMPPPPPKVKLSNMRRVLLTEVTADPTKVEQEVREQIDERKRKHEQANEARKKSGEERREAAREKLAEDRKAGLFAAVYRVGHVHAGHKFKISVNARQLGMTGLLVVYSAFHVVVVEGGEKGLRKFKKLMLRRIKWSDDLNEESLEQKKVSPNDETGQQQDKSKKDCVLVWEGRIPEASFEQFQLISLPNDTDTRSFFRKHGVEHYWELCEQASPTGNENLGVRKLE
ncbi:U4/U6 small nuclear ribonucleoprotein Prp3 [Gracilariopsis chorda]|uniref:U4/U6 small nuclear ribonucleoprotein Prp3 n=1 Tax=Gracilariopsis chorda TaxID=448386 RepID=A0A2V3IHN3_9FLOR|nr:U4/U6 small nuclear ribonucleoprotein Prp3 [Gracilariopsis chorda]|eukprot:PXF41533.1 U4/U6 small nuclear ribonucleoprotein Prp3 [Gracilariopsis chorda]